MAAARELVVLHHHHQKHSVPSPFKTRDKNGNKHRRKEMNPILELPSDVHSTLLLLIFFYIVFILLHLAQKLVKRSIGKLKVHMLKCKEYNLPDITAIGNSERRGTSDMGISSSDHHRVMCLICDNSAAHRCSRCKVAKYCSKSCQIKHWREGHMLECEERESPANVDFASAVSSDGSGTSHMISNSDHRRDLGQVPSTSTRQHICVVCNDWAISRCRRCKVPYCSKTCQIKDWKEGHMLECKEYKPPNSLDSVTDVTSERRDSGHMDISSSGPSSNRDEIPSFSASPHICFVCSNLADTRCSSCQIAKYCSETCQLRHWKEGHKLECKQYRSPANVDSVPAVTKERRDSGHLGISSHRKRDQVPSTSSSSHICFVCGHWAEARCSRCTVTRYCSETCQMKHWNEGHRLECNEYRSPINVDSLPAVSSKQRGSGRLAISSSDYHTDRNPMPSAPASQKFCFVCGDWAAKRCGRCKVVKYCSQTCQIKHWRADHWFKCKENKSPTNLDSTSAFGSERRGSGHMGISSSEYQRSKKDGKFAETVQSSKGTTYSKELRTVEECPICFCTIHTSEPSCSLLACENCKYKFHSACLLKWFSTSKKSHCPLCQSPFKSKGTAL